MRRAPYRLYRMPHLCRLTGKRHTDSRKPRRLMVSNFTGNPKPRRPMDNRKHNRLTGNRLTGKGLIPRRRPTRFIRPCRQKSA